VFDFDLRTIRIASLEGEDILEWGYKTKGMFTIKEAYQQAVEEHLVQYNPL